MKKWKDSLSTHTQAYSALVAEREESLSAFLHVDVEGAASLPANSDDSAQTAGAQGGNIGTNAQATDTAASPTIDPSKNAEQSLASLPFAVKDNIAVQGMPLTCGSKFLENFVSPYSATAVRRLVGRGARVVGKTNLDEFGMGSSTDFSALQQTHNPWDTERVCGGSSGGSAAAVAAGLVPFALGTDTGGSVRQPAAFCGIYGLKPTYGAVSRYGLVAYASSLDTIGVLARDIDLCRAVFEAMRGQDAMDQTSLDSSGLYGEAPTAKLRIAVLAGDLGLSEELQRSYVQASDCLKSQCEVEAVQFPMMEYTAPAYYTIASAEASANLARYNGIRYGKRPIFAENPDELVRRARQAGFGTEVKLRILLGTYVLRSGFQDRYYNRAQQIRRRIRGDFEALFTRYDLLMLPVYPVQAFKHGEEQLDSFQQKLAERFTCTANLSGMPALSCPVGVQAVGSASAGARAAEPAGATGAERSAGSASAGAAQSAEGQPASAPVAGAQSASKPLPCAVQFMAPAFCEDRLFAVAKLLAGAFPLESPPGYEEVFRL